MFEISESLSLPYNYITKLFRVLHHQGLNSILRYPELPRRTTNFDCYPITKLKNNNQLTLNGAVTTIWQRTIYDAVITETWLSDDLSIRAGFFYELLRFYNASLAYSTHLLWMPIDKTDIVFSNQPIDLVVGSSDEMSVHPVHGIGENNYRWLKDEVKFSFRIRKILDIPNASLTVEGI